MALLTIPEFRLKTIIDAILLYIRLNYEEYEDDCHLADLVNGLSYEKYNLYTQAKEIFINRYGDTKELKSNLFFNSERASIPTIHIMLSEENKGPDGISVDENYNDIVYDQVLKTTKEIYNRAFESMMSIVITSDNSFETILIYHILRSCLISAFHDLPFAGIQNPKLSGGTLNINAELVPLDIFYQVINIAYFYDVPAPQIFTTVTFAEIIAQGIAVSTEEDESSS